MRDEKSIGPSDGRRHDPVSGPPAAARNPDSNDDSNDKKTALILGTSADYAPFEFMYPDDKGELTYAGIDVSVAQYIADDMGLSLQVENMAFEYLLTSLGKGDFDMVLAAMEAHPRPVWRTPTFPDPYYNDIPPRPFW